MSDQLSLCLDIMSDHSKSIVIYRILSKIVPAEVININSLQGREIGYLADFRFDYILVILSFVNEVVLNLHTYHVVLCNV